MYDKSQLLKGTLEGCILKILQRETTYSYEIVVRLNEYGFTEVREGTIYPLMLRLEKKKLIFSEFRPSPLGPSRKYFTLTGEGERLLEEFEEAWEETKTVVERILAGRGDCSEE